MSPKEFFFRIFADIEIYPYPFFILFKRSKYKIQGIHMRQILNIIEPGDALLRRMDYYPSSLQIPGYWSHFAIYIGEEKSGAYIIHMTKDGINKEDILTFMECDNLLVLRHPKYSTSQKAISMALNYFNQNIKYDFGFDFVCPKRFSCTEFGIRLYDDLNFQIPLSSDTFYKKWTRRFVKNVVFPDDFLYTSLNTIWRKEK